MTNMPEEIFIYNDKHQRSFYSYKHCENMVKYIRADTIPTAVESSEVDIEELKRSVDMPAYIGAYHDRLNIDLVKNESWNDCLEYLKEQGYLRQPQANIEALKCLETVVSMLSTYEEGIVMQDIETISKALGGQ